MQSKKISITLIGNIKKCDIANTFKDDSISYY